MFNSYTDQVLELIYVKSNIDIYGNDDEGVKLDTTLESLFDSKEDIASFMDEVESYFGVIIKDKDSQYLVTIRDVILFLISLELRELGQENLNQY